MGLLLVGTTFGRATFGQDYFCWGYFWWGYFCGATLGVNRRCYARGLRNGSQSHPKKASACAVQAEVQIGSLCCVSYDYCSTNLVLLQIWPVLRRIKDICLMKMLDKTRSAGIIPRNFNFA